MKKHGNQKCVSLNEALVEKWKKRFILEKGYSEELSEWLTRSLAKLIDHMQYGHVLVAFYKQDATFQLAKATLLPYENFFHRKYDVKRLEATVVYWDVDSQAWRSFQLENLLEWRPFC